MNLLSGAAVFLLFPGQLLRAMSFMGLAVGAAVARVEPNAPPGAATGAAEPKAVLWPKRAMAKGDWSLCPCWKKEGYASEKLKWLSP